MCLKCHYKCYATWSRFFLFSKLKCSTQSPDKSNIKIWFLYSNKALFRLDVMAKYLEYQEKYKGGAAGTGQVLQMRMGVLLESSLCCFAFVMMFWPYQEIKHLAWNVTWLSRNNTGKINKTFRLKRLKTNNSQRKK